MSHPLPVIASGDWQSTPHLGDYRAEWVSDMMVERAAWAADSPQQRLGGVTVAAPGYVWFRFWLVEGNRIVEKYFDAAGQTVGIYVRVGMALPHHGRGFSIIDLILGIWITGDLRVTVQHEESFDAAVRGGMLTPVEAEHAEHQIRELTTAIATKRFPPPMIRNLALADAQKLI